jgi:hypothetical protein
VLVAAVVKVEVLLLVVAAAVVVVSKAAFPRIDMSLPIPENEEVVVGGEVKVVVVVENDGFIVVDDVDDDDTPSPDRPEIEFEFKFNPLVDLPAPPPATPNPPTLPGITIVINLNPPLTNLVESSIIKLSVKMSKNVDVGKVEVRSGRRR